MKEYKLSAKSKYSVLYLLCGLFMFFFMFAIFSLSSHALGNQTISLNLLTQRPSSSDGSCTVTIGSPSFNVTIPANGSLSQDTSLYFSYGYKFVATTTSGNFDLYSGNSGFTATQYVSSNNSFVSSLNVPSNIGSFYLNGQLISVDFELSFTGSYSGSTFLDHINVGGTTQSPSSLGYGSFQSNNYGYAYGTTSISVPTFNLSKNTNFVSVSSSSSSSYASYFGDYSSFNLLSNVSDLTPISSFSDKTFPSGSPIYYDFPDYNGTSITFLDGYIPFFRVASDNVIIAFVVTQPSGTGLSFTNLSCRFLDFPGDVTYNSSNIIIQWLSNDGTYDKYLCYWKLNLPYKSFDDNLKVQFNFYGSLPYATNGFCFFALSYSATISDYMSSINSEWNSISPSVTDTNTNTAQSVSDIGAAQTFETSAFTDFDSAMTSSGLDSFSLSFDSTPLLWCASIINTFYNNMPSGFQYLLMFVAFIGILVVVLNISGRVVRRFGGD